MQQQAPEYVELVHLLHASDLSIISPVIWLTYCFFSLAIGTFTCLAFNVYKPSSSQISPIATANTIYIPGGLKWATELTSQLVLQVRDGLF